MSKQQRLWDSNKGRGNENSLKQRGFRGVNALVRQGSKRHKALKRAFRLPRDSRGGGHCEMRADGKCDRRLDHAWEVASAVDSHGSHLVLSGPGPVICPLDPLSGAACSLSHPFSELPSDSTDILPHCTVGRVAASALPTGRTQLTPWTAGLLTVCTLECNPLKVRVEGIHSAKSTLAR